MEKRHQILWYEGMNLEPHHFQQWDRFIRSNLDFRIKSVNTDNWGLAAIKLDEDALANGKINIIGCSGIMPDGLVFDMPANDSLPPSREFTKYFSSTQTSLAVYLSIPNERIGEQNFSLDKSTNKRNTRYFFEQVMINDENVGDIINKMILNHTRKIIFKNTSSFISDRIIIQTIAQDLNYLRDMDNFLDLKFEKPFKLEDAKHIPEDFNLTDLSKLMFGMMHPCVITKEQIYTPWDICLALLSDDVFFIKSEYTSYT